MDTRLMFSNETVEWETPKEIFDYLDNIYHFTLDPCCHKKTAKCNKFYTIEDDGLKRSWEGETVFMNPPYGREIGNWVKKAWSESSAMNTIIVCLLPARTDTKWWHDYVMFANEIWFVKGRLKFQKWKASLNDYKPTEESTSAPFPSAIVIFSENIYIKNEFKSFDWREEI